MQQSNDDHALYQPYSLISCSRARLYSRSRVGLHLHVSSLGATLISSSPAFPCLPHSCFSTAKDFTLDIYIIPYSEWKPFFYVLAYGMPALCFSYMLLLVTVPFSREGVRQACLLTSSEPSVSPPVLRHNLRSYLSILTGLFGPLRGQEESKELKRHYSDIIFKHTIARKHPCVVLQTAIDMIY